MSSVSSNTKSTLCIILCNSLLHLCHILLHSSQPLFYSPIRLVLRLLRFVRPYNFLFPFSFPYHFLPPFDSLRVPSISSRRLPSESVYLPFPYALFSPLCISNNCPTPFPTTLHFCPFYSANHVHILKASRFGLKGEILSYTRFQLYSEAQLRLSSNSTPTQLQL